MKLKLLLFAPIIMAILFSCGEEENISVKPQTKDSLKTDTVKADTVKADTVKVDSTRDSLDWYHLENVKPIDYNLSTDLIPVYATSYKNIYVGNILYVNASTLQEPKFVSNINYLEKIDIMCEYNANLYSTTELPSYDATHNIINKLPNDIEQNGNFNTSSPVKLKSLKALHFYSEAKIGIPLDEVFFYDGYKNHVGKKALVIFTRSVVNIYINGTQVATHMRSYEYGHTYIKEHLASNCRAIMERSASYYITCPHCRDYKQHGNAACVSINLDTGFGQCFKCGTKFLLKERAQKWQQHTRSFNKKKAYKRPSLQGLEKAYNGTLVDYVLKRGLDPQQCLSHGNGEVSDNIPESH